MRAIIQEENIFFSLHNIFLLQHAATRNNKAGRVNSFSVKV
jgi:hypothetical protein